MSEDDESELFEIQVRGALASAFINSGRAPIGSQWDVLRGGTLMTMRDIAEIGSDTGHLVSLRIAAKPPREKAPEDQS